MRNTAIYKLIQYKLHTFQPPLEETLADVYMNILNKYPENTWFSNEKGNPDNDFEILEKLAFHGVICRITIPFIIEGEFKGILNRYLYKLDINYDRHNNY